MFWETVLIFFWETLKLWLSVLFIAPFKNLNMLWVLIPVYLTWFFAEFFQEKQGTSMGNAVTNAVVVFWGGADWLRRTIDQITIGLLKFGALTFGKIALAVLLIIYGIFIVLLGFKGKRIIKYLGRIREVTYFVVFFTPVYYGVMDLSWQLIFASFLFFPIFYFAIELLDKYMPNPKAVEEDLNHNNERFETDTFAEPKNDFESENNPEISKELSSEKENVFNEFPRN